MRDFPSNITKKELERSRLANKYGIDNSIPENLLDNSLRVAWWLQKLRDRLKAAYGREMYIIIASGYRCDEVNNLAKGSKTSAHRQALGADITVPGIEPKRLAAFIAKNMNDAMYDQVINEYDSWVHVGLRPAGQEPRMMYMAAIHAKGSTRYVRLDK